MNPKTPLLGNDGIDDDVYRPHNNRRRWFPVSNPFRYNRIFNRIVTEITWSRIKILVVLIILIFTILLFSTEAEGSGSLNLAATARGRPLVSIFEIDQKSL